MKIHSKEKSKNLNDVAESIKKDIEIYQEVLNRFEVNHGDYVIGDVDHGGFLPQYFTYEGYVVGYRITRDGIPQLVLKELVNKENGAENKISNIFTIEDDKKGKYHCISEVYDKYKNR